MSNDMRGAAVCEGDTVCLVEILALLFTTVQVTGLSSSEESEDDDLCRVVVVCVGGVMVGVLRDGGSILFVFVTGLGWVYFVGVKRFIILIFTILVVLLVATS